MPDPPANLLTIGEVAKRAGVSVPTLRFYEQRGLITSTRSVGNQRRFPRHVPRRLAFIAAAQRVSLTLEQIAAGLFDPDRLAAQEISVRLTAAAVEEWLIGAEAAGAVIPTVSSGTPGCQRTDVYGGKASR